MPIVYVAENYCFKLSQIKGVSNQISQQGESSHVTDNIVKQLQDECVSTERINHLHQDTEEEQFAVHLTRRVTSNTAKGVVIIFDQNEYKEKNLDGDGNTPVSTYHKVASDFTNTGAVMQRDGDDNASSYNTSLPVVNIQP